MIELLLILCYIDLCDQVFLALKFCMKLENNRLCCNCNQDGIMDGDIDQSTLELTLQVGKF